MLKSPDSPYIFTFIGFNLATAALVVTLHYTVPKNLLEKLDSFLNSKERLSKLDKNSIKTYTSSLVHYFYWVDFITYSWLITLVFSIADGGALLLPNSQLGVWCSPIGVKLILTLISALYGFFIIMICRKVYHTRVLEEKKIPWQNFTWRWYIFCLILFSIVAVAMAGLPWLCANLNSLLIAFIVLFILHLSLWLYGEYKYMPLTTISKLWNLLDKKSY